MVFMTKLMDIYPQSFGNSSKWTKSLMVLALMISVMLVDISPYEYNEVNGHRP